MRSLPLTWQLEGRHLASLAPTFSDWGREKF